MPTLALAEPLNFNPSSKRMDSIDQMAQFRLAPAAASTGKLGANRRRLRRRLAIQADPSPSMATKMLALALLSVCVGTTIVHGFLPPPVLQTRSGPATTRSAFQQQPHVISSTCTTATRNPLLVAFNLRRLPSQNQRRQEQPSTVLLYQARQTETTTKSKNMEEEEEALSDVDARVLQAMLREQKLDLQSEEDIRKLLERGTVKKTKKPTSKIADDNGAENSSQFSSTFFKTVTDSKLWKAFSKQASETLESVGIWVANKVEQDVKVLAALGLFAWDRAVRDVSRALPAAEESAKRLLLLANVSSAGEEFRRNTPFLLTSNSSFAAEQQPAPQKSILEEMNRPEDEIKSVTRDILDILRGEYTNSQRGLRTAAPAGSAFAAERQRRAFQQRRKLDSTDVTRVAGSMVDTAYELQRELGAESNPAGYKSEPVRRAIAATVTQTGNLLRAVQESARLAAAKRQEQRLLSATDVTATVVPEHRNLIPAVNRTLLVQELLAERRGIFDRLTVCIEQPQNTWLKTELVVSPDGTMLTVNEDDLRSVVTMMVFVRKEMEAQEEEELPVDGTDPTAADTAVRSLLDQLRREYKEIEDLRSRVATAVSFRVAEVLYSEILGEDESQELPWPLRLDEMEKSLELMVEPEEPNFVSTIPAVPMNPAATFASNMYSSDARWAGPTPDVAAPNEASTANTARPSKNSHSSYSVVEEVKDVVNVPNRPANPWNGQDPATQSAQDFFFVAADEEMPTTVTGAPSRSPEIESRLDSIEAPASVRTQYTAEIVDVVPEVVIESEMRTNFMSPSTFTSSRLTNAVVDYEVLVEQVEDDAVSASLMAEIITDDAFEVAVGQSKSVKAVSDEELEKESEGKKENIAIFLLLRSLDVLLFVLEKTITVVIPKAFVIGSNVARELEEVKLAGKGSKGWQPIRKSADPKGKY